MGKINLTTDNKGIKIYRKDKVSNSGNKYSTYCIKVSSKKQDNSYANAFINVKFKKDVAVNNKAVIEIKNAFPTINEYNGTSNIIWMITDFTVIEAGEVPADGADFMNIDDSVDGELPFI